MFFIGWLGIFSYMDDRYEELVSQLLRDASFQRWALDEASSSETEKWAAWIDADAAHAQAARDARATIRLAQFKPDTEKAAELDAAWKRFEERRAARSDDTPEPPPRSAPKRSRRAARRSGRSGVRRAWIATLAVILIAVGIVVQQEYAPDLLPRTETHVVETAHGERTTVALSDGLTATLSGNSAISYDPEAPHTVELTGEARFDVPERTSELPPFEVNTPDGFIRVTGTTFTVSHWKDETDVVLTSGAVTVAAAHEKADEHQLAPGDWITFARTEGVRQQRTTNPEAYQSWTTDTIVFDDTSVQTIAQRIERIYGYEVVVRDAEVLDTKISGAVENQIDVLLEGLRRILDRPVHHEDRRIVIE